MFAIIGLKINNELIDGVSVIRPSDNWLLKVKEEELITKPIDSTKTFILMSIEDASNKCEVDFMEFRSFLHHGDIYGVENALSERYLVFPEERIVYFMNKVGLNRKINDRYLAGGVHRLCWHPDEVHNIEIKNKYIYISHSCGCYKGELKNNELNNNEIIEDFTTQFLLWRVLD